MEDFGVHGDGSSEVGHLVMLRLGDWVNARYRHVHVHVHQLISDFTIDKYYRAKCSHLLGCPC